MRAPDRPDWLAQRPEIVGKRLRPELDQQRLLVPAIAHDRGTRVPDRRHVAQGAQLRLQEVVAVWTVEQPPRALDSFREHVGVNATTRMRRKREQRAGVLLRR